MFSRFLNYVLAVPFLFCLLVLSAQARDLRVCADPSNLPFSNRNQQGFENRIAEIVAGDLKAHLTYVWQRMGRGFVREYLDKAQCDLIVGIPTNFRTVLTTTPYYRSDYVFVSRRDKNLNMGSFDSPQLRGSRIGVQVLAEQYTPPGEALARRGLQGAIVGFDTNGEDADSIIRAVVNRQVDASIVWGPLAGYYSRRYRDTILLTPVQPEVDPSGLPFTFAISMGVRKDDGPLREELEQILRARKAEIRAVLDEYGVPQLPLPLPVNTQGVGH